MWYIYFFFVGMSGLIMMSPGTPEDWFIGLFSAPELWKLKGHNMIDNNHDFQRCFHHNKDFCPSLVHPQV